VTPGHEAAPLSDAEHWLLQQIAQELARTDPDLGAGADAAPPRPTGTARAVVAAYTTGSCVAIGALTETAGPLVAFVTGAALAVVGAALGGAITGPATRRQPRDHPDRRT
jgi:Protein of unknown function (DUF3040)